MKSRSGGKSFAVWGSSRMLMAVVVEDGEWRVAEEAGGWEGEGSGGWEDG
jgi:hypothetical protein